MALLSNRKFFWHKSNFSTNLSTAISIFCLICVCVCVWRRSTSSAPMITRARWTCQIVASASAVGWASVSR